MVGLTFGEGTLVSLDLAVPDAFGFLGSISIAASPDTFAHGFEEIPTIAGQLFELVVTPEPSTGAIVLSVMLGLIHRRRRR